MKILLIRHGQTEANNLRLIQGSTDNPLNQTGIKQAHQVGLFLKKKNKIFDHAYSSPLLRAVQTGEIILDYLDKSMPIHLDKHFVERDFGPYESMPIGPFFHKLIKDEYEEDGFENNKSMLKRIKTGLVGLYKKHANENLILFCHSHVIKSFLILADKKNYDYRLFLHNASMHEFSYDGKNLKILNLNIIAQ